MLDTGLKLLSFFIHRPKLDLEILSSESKYRDRLNRIIPNSDKSLEFERQMSSRTYRWDYVLHIKNISDVTIRSIELHLPSFLRLVNEFSRLYVLEPKKEISVNVYVERSCDVDYKTMLQNRNQYPFFIDMIPISVSYKGMSFIKYSTYYLLFKDGCQLSFYSKISYLLWKKFHKTPKKKRK